MATWTMRPRLGQALIDSAPIVGMDHVTSAMDSFHQAQWHQHMALCMAVQGLSTFSGHVRPESLSEVDKVTMKESNVVLRDYVSFLLLASVGDARNCELLEQHLEEFANDELASQLRQSLVKTLRGIQLQPLEYITPEAARRRRRQRLKEKRRQTRAGDSGNPQSDGSASDVIRQQPAAEAAGQSWGHEAGSGEVEVDDEQAMTEEAVMGEQTEEAEIGEQREENSLDCTKMPQPAVGGEQPVAGEAEIAQMEEDDGEELQQHEESEAWSPRRKDDESPSEYYDRAGICVKNGFLEFKNAANSAKCCATEPGHRRRSTDQQTADTQSCAADDITLDDFDMEMCRQATEMLLRKMAVCPCDKLHGLTSRLSRELQVLPVAHDLKKKAVERIRQKVSEMDFSGSDETSKILSYVLADLCHLSGPGFPELQLAHAHMECQARVWAEFLERLDGQNRFWELDCDIENVLRSTMSMLRGPDKQNFKKMFAPTFQALQKLVCGSNGVSRISDECVVQAGQWILDQMQRAFREGLTSNDPFTIKEKGIRSFCALFRYKRNREVFGVGLCPWDSHDAESQETVVGIGVQMRGHVERTLEAMYQHASDMDEHYFADVFRILVYTHPFAEVLALIDASSRGGKDKKLFLVLNEIQKCLEPMTSALVRHVMRYEAVGQADGWTKKAEDALKQIRYFPAAGVQQDAVSVSRLAAWLYELEATDWRRAAAVLTVLFGEVVISELACCREIHEDFVAESKLFYDVCRGLQDASRLVPCAWDVRLQVTRNMTQLADSLELRGRPRSGHPSSWSAWISTLGEFLAANVLQDGTFDPEAPDNERHIRQVEGKIDRVLTAFAEDGKLQEMIWGPFWNEAFWSLRMFFGEAQLPGKWYENIVWYAEQIEDYVDEQVGEHRRALERARSLTEQK
eukprot:TRINITY_DN23218_c0_g1_i1.p1 TRINITY_DN23218_c0_g1~~TRINITY_DN23218_c0_g1_i1.p1  ORF type:complete len:914 (-),score=190.00 TRINITY_DN23218_c0_g1_i1:252-2993(-)